MSVEAITRSLSMLAETSEDGSEVGEVARMAMKVIDDLRIRVNLAEEKLRVERASNPMSALGLLMEWTVSEEELDGVDHEKLVERSHRGELPQPSNLPGYYRQKTRMRLPELGDQVMMVHARYVVPRIIANRVNMALREVSKDHGENHMSPRHPYFDQLHERLVEESDQLRGMKLVLQKQRKIFEDILQYAKVALETVVKPRCYAKIKELCLNGLATVDNQTESARLWRRMEFLERLAKTERPQIAAKLLMAADGEHEGYSFDFTEED